MVRGGADARLPDDRETGQVRHTLPAVYGEMLLLICMNYPSLPEPRTLRISEIRFFYDGIRAQLVQMTTPRK